MSAHDVNDNGWIVAIGVVGSSAHAFVLFPEKCPADITGPTECAFDGNVDSLDFLMLIGSWGSPCPSAAPCGCAADITGPTPFEPDGNVDALDFLEFLNEWGSPSNCCIQTASNVQEASTPPPGGLTLAEWTVLRDAALADSEAERVCATCWLEHYVSGCTGANCGFHGCDGSSDPLERH